MTEVCDASPYLLRAAKFHGRGSDVVCPICRREQLTIVSWVFGDKLGQASGSARTPEELTRLASSQEEFSVHVVEVCRTCSWNHLVQSYVLGAQPAPKRPRRRSTVRVDAPRASERTPDDVTSTCPTVYTAAQDRTTESSTTCPRTESRMRRNASRRHLEKRT